MATQTARRFTEETLKSEKLERTDVQAVNQLADSAMKRLMLVRDQVEREKARENIDPKSLRTMMNVELEKIIFDSTRG